MTTPSQETLRKFWNDAETALSDIDPHNGQRTAFDISRRLQGLLLQHNLTGEPGAFTDLITEYAEENGLEPEDLEAEVFLAWGSVIVPEGGDPVVCAAMAAGGQPIPADFMPAAPLKVRKQAYATLLICRRLGGDGSRPFFISCRKLGDALQISHMTAARLLDMLCRENFIERSTKKATREQAQYYRLKMLHRNLGTHELKNLGTHELKNLGTHERMNSRTKEHMAGKNSGGSSSCEYENISIFPKEATQ